MLEKLVSIITPCYNCESYLYRFLDSVLCQTYQRIELILVNDGSTDTTETVIFKYKKLFEEKGIVLKYLSQINGGPAAAINSGLKIFEGDYLTWIDCDDWMLPHCIEKKVDFLEHHQDVGLVVCEIAVVSEKNIDEIISVKKVKENYSRNYFERMLKEEVYIAPPIGWMVRSSMFLQVNPQRHIYDGNKAGQNWQMLLPLSYYFNGGYIDEVLGYYLIRNNSISHANRGIGLIEKSYEYEKNCCEALKSLILENEEEYLKAIAARYARSRLVIAYSEKLNDQLYQQYDELKKMNKVTIKDKIYFLCGKYKIFRAVRAFFNLPFRAIWKIKRICLKKRKVNKG